MSNNRYTLISPLGQMFIGSIPEIVREYNKPIRDDRLKLRRGGLYRLKRGLAKKGMYKFCTLIMEETTGWSANRQWICNRAMVMGKRPLRRLSIDHINRNRLYNRKSNLRWATKKNRTMRQWTLSTKKTCPVYKRILGYVTKSGKSSARFREAYWNIRKK